MGSVVDLCRLYDLYSWGQISKAEFYEGCIETLIMAGLDCALSAIPGGKLAKKAAEKFLRKLLGAIAEKIVSSMFFDQVNNQINKDSI